MARQILAFAFLALFAFQISEAFPRSKRQAQVSQITQKAQNDAQTSREVNSEVELITDAEKEFAPVVTTEAQSRGYTTELSGAEIKEDLEKIASAVEQEEEKHGHPITKTELQEVEHKLEERPWYRRLGNWLGKQFHTARKAVAKAFSSREASREQRGYPDFYHMYSD